MNEDNKRAIETKQDVEKLEQELFAMKERIIDNAPKLYLEVKDVPFYLDRLFDTNGNPLGDFKVSDKYKKRVVYALKNPHKKPSTGQVYFGELVEGDYYAGKYYPREYVIEATPTTFTEEDLDILQNKHKITKSINGVELELYAPYNQRNNFSWNVDRYRKSIEVPRRKLKEIDKILTSLAMVKEKLPWESRIVSIEDTPRR